MPSPAKKATPEQEAVFASEGHILKVKAFAGTGKTTTLQGLAARHPHERILYVAFNKGIQREAATKFGRNVTARTAHSLAYSAVGYQYGQVTDKLQGGLRPFHVLPEIQHSVRALPPSSHNLYGARVIETIQSYLVSASLEMGPAHVSLGASPVEKKHFDPTRILADAGRVWDSMQDPYADVPMLHDGYLKLFQCEQPDLGYDRILLDEAQDTNPVTQALVQAQAGRRVYVGDEHQAIYGFRGASNAMALIEADEDFCLTGSFRFGPAVAEVANDILSLKREAVTLQGLGAVSRVGDLPPETAYAFIARGNTALFSRAVGALENHVPFAFVGAVPNYRFDLITQTYRLFNGQRVYDPFLRSFADFEALEEYAQIMGDKEIAGRCRLVKKYGDRLPLLVDRIHEKAGPMSSAQMILTSAHRSKGLEFNQVQMADDFMDFYDEKNGVWKDFSEADATTLEEVNLQYVAATRARKVLQVGERLLAYLQMTQMRRTAPAPEPVVRRFGLLDRPLRATAVG